MLTRPNILLILADQLPAAALRAYGHPVVRSPRLDALAAAGVRFDQAYTNCPLSAPARATLCTGRLSGKLGVYDNAVEFGASVPTFAHHLRGAGYATLAAGKMHFVGPDQLHGFERRLTTDIFPSSFAWTPDWRGGACPNPGSSAAQLRQSGPCTWSDALRYDEEVQFRTLEALRELAGRRGRRQPFLLCASFTHPHQPLTITRRWWDLYEDAAIDAPAAPAVPLEQMHPFDRWIQIHHQVDRYPPSDDDVARSRRAYYGMVSCVDDKVGALRDELARLGLANNTVVIFSAGHGEMLGEHGMWFERTCFDRAVRVPLLAAGPGLPAGRVVDATVSLADLFPSMLELAGMPKEMWNSEELDGRSIAPLMRGSDAETDRPAVIDYLGEGTCQPVRAVVRERLKYIHVHGEAPRLFDLASDPLERADRSRDPAYAARRDALARLALVGWDGEAVRRRVLRSQQDRLRIHPALQRGRVESWDAAPHFDPAQQYCR
jgi:choline-sulfatase